MVKTSYIIIIVIVLALAILLVISVTHPMWNSELVSPNLVSLFLGKPKPTPSSASGPKTFKFDSQTDLKKELDSVNTEVLDSDFNE